MSAPVRAGVRAACYVLLPRDPAREGAARAQLDAFLRARGVQAVRYVERADGRRRRPKLKLMLKRAAHGLYDVVYVLRFRDLAFPGWGVAHIVVQLGVPVTDVEGTTLNPADRVVRWLAAERARRSARITRALARKKAKGEWVGESRWGYQVGADGVHEEPDDHEQAAAQLARRLRQQGMSYRAIAREVTAAGYCSREGTPVTHFQVRRWLDRPYGDGGPPKPDDHRPDAPATEPGPHRG